MDFNQYKEDVEKALNKWLSTLHSGSKTAAEELKESTGDLITGWKDSFPRRKEDIETFVNDTMEKFFKEKEGE